MQTGFGAFVTVYLVENLWPPQAIGFALTVATMSSLLSQIPAGAALDTTAYATSAGRCCLAPLAWASQHCCSA